MTLNVTDLFRTYGDFQLRVDVTVAKGEFLSVIGPSGCGKSTLLRMVAGLEAADGGSIALNGQEISVMAPEKRGIGMVFQDYALFPHMRVAENVAYGLKLRKMGKGNREARVRELLELVRLTDKADDFPATLSGGEQQRVALARAIAPNPSVLLLDEPLSALDARLRIDLRRQIREVHDRLSLTTLYVTHDQEEALTLSDRIAVMRQGRILQTGSPRALYETPGHLFTGTFLGLSNTLEGRLEAGWFVTEEGQKVSTARGEDGPGVLFFRPHHVVLHGEPAPGRLPFSVTRVEYCGGWSLVHGTTGPHGVVVFDSAETRWAAGQQGHLEVVSGQAQFFPGETGVTECTPRF
ncbi:ABC transporter ATP-binding protein [Desulfoluna spongiiphila]|uniref:Putative spermidine/putrescine transport system ATP-binding protein/thiamine transport system ATP-binding protein n=1 Tax=Desulfoluna spongiiphila TaxID=419481 RepID=A0A1G5ATF0_9BACT|nr:ABC transporter ATP-binding protein [Desulfoluna spongiiphila]SCX81182.1 putative spermidine/putrescine transport system ATP-binding protein/thiamine transport system ATP-binding protein [Desulfoluna spongiiphila]